MQDLVRLYGIVEYPRSTSEIKGKTKKIAKFQLPDKESFSITYFLKKSILFCFFSNILHNSLYFAHLPVPVDTKSRLSFLLNHLKRKNILY